MKKIITIVIVSFMFSCIAKVAHVPSKPEVVNPEQNNKALSVTLAWDMPTTNTDGTPITDLGGAKIYYGFATRTYPNVIDVGNVTQYTINNIEPDKTYYFAATAYNTNNNESDYSEELVWHSPQRGTKGISKITLK